MEDQESRSSSLFDARATRRESEALSVCARASATNARHLNTSGR